MTENDAKDAGLELLENNNELILGTVDEMGFPQVKALLNMGHEGLKYVWFSTNTSSRHIQEILANPKTCVYAVDLKQRKGLTLTGSMEILQDDETKRRFWREGYERYYSQGISDPDYSVMRFTAYEGRYYHRLQKVSFKIEDKG